MNEFSKLPTMYRRAYYGAKQRAGKNGWEVLTQGEFLALVDRASGRCELTGKEFSEEPFTVPWRNRKPFQSYPCAPSIDRREITKGYELSNVRLVCSHVNNALSYLPEKVFAEMCRAFVRTHGLESDI